MPQNRDTEGIWVPSPWKLYLVSAHINLSDPAVTAIKKKWHFWNVIAIHGMRQDWEVGLKARIMRLGRGL